MLTTRQQEIWQFLAEYVDAHGYPPTVREIGDAVGLASPWSTRSRAPREPRADRTAQARSDEASRDRARRTEARGGT